MCWDWLVDEKVIIIVKNNNKDRSIPGPHHLHHKYLLKWRPVPQRLQYIRLLSSHPQQKSSPSTHSSCNAATDTPSPLPYLARHCWGINTNNKTFRRVRNNINFYRLQIKISHFYLYGGLGVVWELHAC